MNTAEWFLLVGGILLVRGVSASLFRHLPVTPAIVYLLAGLLVGPTVLNVFHFNPLKESGLLETLTEVVVLISLFSAGVKMPAPVTFARWRAPVLLASVSMVVSVGLIAAYASQPPGSYCELRVMPAKCVCKLPDAISFETGAAMMLKGLTAQYLLKKTQPQARISARRVSGSG